MSALLEKYLSDVKAWLPVSSLAVLLIAFLLSVISSKAPDSEVLVFLLMSPLTSFTFEDGGMLHEAMVLDLAVALLIVVLARLLHQVLAGISVRWLWKALDVRRKSEGVIEKFPDPKSIDAEARSSMIERARAAVASGIKKCKFYSELSMLLFGAGLSFVLVSFSSSRLELFLGVTLLLLSLVAQSWSIASYLSRVLPSRLKEAALVGVGVELDSLIE